jgi:hypothetical protein
MIRLSDILGAAALVAIMAALMYSPVWFPMTKALFN